MKKVLISGVTGQDGSYMVDYLLANTEHMIYGMVRRTANPNYRNIEHNLNNPRFKLVTGDLTDGSSIESLVRELQPDYFINFAAQSFVGSSWQIPEQTFDTVAMGVIRCLEAIRKHAPHCRYYSSGSSEEMGDVQYSPQDINHPIRPRSPYGSAKAAARHIVKVWRESYGLYAIHSILYNHESPRRGEEFVSRKIANGVAQITKAIKDKKPFEPISLGNLEARRDWSFSGDFIDGIWKMMNQVAYPNNKPDGITEYDHTQNLVKARAWTPKEYLLASGETHTVRSFAEKAFALAGWQNLTWVKGERPEDEYLKGVIYADYQGALCSQTHTLVVIDPRFYRPADVELLLGDSTPARQELSWEPKVSFDELVKEMVTSELRQVGL